MDVQVELFASYYDSTWTSQMESLKGSLVGARMEVRPVCNIACHRREEQECTLSPTR